MPPGTVAEADDGTTRMLLSMEVAVTVRVAPVGPTPPEVPAMLVVQVVPTGNAWIVATPAITEIVAHVGVPEVHVTEPAAGATPFDFRARNSLV